MKDRVWGDHKERNVLIHTMSNRWLNNLRKYLRKNNPEGVELRWVKEELKRREELNKKLK